MKTKLNLCFIACLIAFTSHAQVNFEPGIIITKSGQKIECLIENKDWFFSPEIIRYKINETSEIKSVTPAVLKSFQIGDVRYVGARVNVNQSPTKDLDLDYTPEPKLESKTIFLKELFAGEASLYMYNEKSTEQYFYSLGQSEIVPLIYKKYYTQDEQDKGVRRIRTNDEYKNTLFSNLKCNDIDVTDVRELSYDARSLKSFFSDYDYCKTGVKRVVEKNKNKGKLNLRAKVGVNSNQLDIKASTSNFDRDLRSTSFDNQLSVRFGAELEYIFGFNKNKWSLFVEPSFLSFSGESVISETSQFNAFVQNVSVDYKVIEIPIGVRHYMFLNDNSSLFLNVAAVFSNDLSDLVDYERLEDLAINTELSFYAGLGYEFNKRFSIEARVYSTRETLGGFISFRGPLNTSALVIGYQFL